MNKNDLLKSFAQKAKRRLVGRENVCTAKIKIISNDDEEINHSELLKKLNINNEDLKLKASFDIYITLNSGKTYKSNIELELPINDVVNDGTQSMEYTNLENIVFKRI